MKRIYRFLAVGLVLVVLGTGYFFINLTIFDRTFIQLNTSQKNQANKLGFFLSIFSIKNDGNWPIIYQLHLHIRSKDACLNRDFLS